MINAKQQSNSVNIADKQFTASAKINSLQVLSSVEMIKMALVTCKADPQLKCYETTPTIFQRQTYRQMHRKTLPGPGTITQPHSFRYGNH